MPHTCQAHHHGTTTVLRCTLLVDHPEHLHRDIPAGRAWNDHGQLWRHTDGDRPVGRPLDVGIVGITGDPDDCPHPDCHAWHHTLGWPDSPTTIHPESAPLAASETQLALALSA